MLECTAYTCTYCTHEANLFYVEKLQNKMQKLFALLDFAPKKISACVEIWKTCK